MNKRLSMELIKDVKTQLLENCSNVYYRESAESKTYPMIVFDIRPTQERRMVLELDLWDVRERIVDNTPVYGDFAIRELADVIEYHLDETVISKQEYIASFMSNNDAKVVLDENKDIKHLNMSFDIIYQS